LKLPANLDAGNYDWLLNLPDAYPMLAGNSSYSIRLANENGWEPESGYNKLNSKLVVAK